MHNIHAKVIAVLGINTIPVGLWLANAEAVAVIVSSVTAFAFTLYQFYHEWKRRHKR